MSARRISSSPRTSFRRSVLGDLPLSAATTCVIFSYSDRAAQEALGFWREET